MNEGDTSSSEIRVTAGQRDPEDRSLCVIATMGGGEEFKLALWPPQWRTEPTRFAKELCNRYPGVGPRERGEVAEQVKQICKEHRFDIDLYPPHHGKINGRATTSIDHHLNGKPGFQDSGNLFSARTQRLWAVQIAQLEAGADATNEKVSKLAEQIEAFLRAKSQEVRKLMQTPQARRVVDVEHCPYRDDGGHIVMATKDGETALSNFAARMVAVVVRHDGEEGDAEFELDVTTARGASKRRIRVKASKFVEMKWPVEQLYDDGYINPDRNAASHVRAAIMKLSRDPKPERKMIYTHTGWKKLESADWVYFHGGGAIAAKDVKVVVNVELHRALSRYVLPEPPEGDKLKECIRSSMKLLALGPAHVVYPLYAAVWRSILGFCDCGVFLAGPSGTFKSELAALFLQHFGEQLDKVHLPANWSSTGNSLELLAFACKDALLVIDDFAPCGNKGAVDGLHAVADRVFRAQGNHSGRQRTSKEGNVGEPKPPRGMIVGTGEDIPRGQSLRARLMICELSPGAIEPAALGAAQRDARRGLYAGCTAGFVRWLCEGNRIEQIQKNLRSMINKKRDEATKHKLHARTPEVVANLWIGFDCFITFAMEVGAIDHAEADVYRSLMWEALGEAARLQAKFQAAQEPTRLWLDSLLAAIRAGEAYLSDMDGNAPDEAIAARCGWFKHSPMSNTWEPRGLWVGCVDDREIYVDEKPAYKVVQRLTGDALSISSDTLCTRLRERKCLEGVEAGRNKKRKRFKGSPAMLLWIKPASLPLFFDPPARTDDEQGEETSSGDQE